MTYLISEFWCTWTRSYTASCYIRLGNDSIYLLSFHLLWASFLPYCIMPFRKPFKQYFTFIFNLPFSKPFNFGIGYNICTHCKHGLADSYLPLWIAGFSFFLFSDCRKYYCRSITVIPLLSGLRVHWMSLQIGVKKVLVIEPNHLSHNRGCIELAGCSCCYAVESCIIAGQNVYTRPLITYSGLVADVNACYC